MLFAEERMIPHVLEEAVHGDELFWIAAEGSLLPITVRHVGISLVLGKGECKTELPVVRELDPWRMAEVGHKRADLIRQGLVQSEQLVAAAKDHARELVAQAVLMQLCQGRHMQAVTWHHQEGLHTPNVSRMTWQVLQLSHLSKVIKGREEVQLKEANMELLADLLKQGPLATATGSSHNGDTS
jgi:hypothetical protein